MAYQTKVDIVRGDATSPVRNDPAKKVIIPHVCNNLGKWGKGFVLALSAKFPNVEKDYKALGTYKMGDVQFVHCNDIVVANMIAQNGIRTCKERRCPPLRYDALWDCMLKVHAKAEEICAEIHAPKFGTGLAGGDWRIVQNFIVNLWIDKGITVRVYEFDEPGSSQSKTDIFEEISITHPLKTGGFAPGQPGH